jgi:lysophospholipase L1-like esterase
VRYRLVPPRRGAPPTRASTVTVYARAERDAVLAIEVDGALADTWQLARSAGDAKRVVAVPDERHTVRVRVKRGRARVFGAAFERGRGVVWDGMGVIGARAARWRKADAGHLATQHEQRPVDLLVLQYGGNSRLDRLSRGRYKERYAEVIARMRADDPQRPCLLVGPSDHAAKGSRRESDPNTVRINGWQRELADEVGCAFFDTIAFMGGEGSVHRWHKRGWVAPDRAHLTARGNRRLGEGLLRALYRGLAGVR